MIASTCGKRPLSISSHENVLVTPSFLVSHNVKAINGIILFRAEHKVSTTNPWTPVINMFMCYLKLANQIAILLGNNIF